MDERKESKDVRRNPRIILANAPKEDLGQTNFDFLYDSFHQPLTDAITSEGAIIGMNKKGEIKHFDHTAQTREAESELCKHAKARNIELLDAILARYYNDSRGALDDTLKYILCFYKGVSEYLKTNYEQAEKSFQYCFNLFDGDPQVYYDLGLTYMMKKQYYKAIVMIEWCCKLDPHHAYAVNNIAYLCILLKKYKEASDACSNAYNVNRGAHNYFRNWAIALMNQNLYSDAVDVIKDAIENDPKDYKNWVVWAEIMKAKGEFASAMEMYRKAIRLNDSDPYPKKELAKLNVLTQKNVDKELQDVIVKLSENYKADSEVKKRENTCI